MNWITTKLLAYVSGGLLLALLAVSTYAYMQHQVAERRQSDVALAEGKLDVALAANVANVAMIQSLQAERDAFVLKRAMEQEQARKLVAQSQYEAKQALEYALAAKERIRQLSRRGDCQTAMQMPICPALADELRAVP